MSVIEVVLVSFVYDAAGLANLVACVALVAANDGVIVVFGNSIHGIAVCNKSK